jgi:hypothetical protein
MRRVIAAARGDQSAGTQSYIIQRFCPRDRFRWTICVRQIFRDGRAKPFAIDSQQRTIFVTQPRGCLMAVRVPFRPERTANSESKRVATRFSQKENIETAYKPITRFPPRTNVRRAIASRSISMSAFEFVKIDWCSNKMYSNINAYLIRRRVKCFMTLNYMIIVHL